MSQEQELHGDSISSCELIPLQHCCNKHTYIHTYMYVHIASCSYNALKFHIQEGDLNYQLGAPVHLFCASCAGNMVTLCHYVCVCTWSVLELAEEVGSPSQLVIQHRKMNLYCLYGDFIKTWEPKGS